MKSVLYMMQNTTTGSHVSTDEIKAKGLYSISFRRRFTKNLVAVLLVVLTLLILLPLFDILYSILSFGLPTMLKDFPYYFVTSTNASIIPQGGQNAIWGTLMIVLTTCVISLPIGIPAGIYLASSSQGRFISFVRLVADVLQSAPSVILGFVIYVWWIIPRGTTGYGWTASGLALSFLMIPIVTRTTEEGLRTVPTAIYEAATSLGLPEWRITLSIAVKSAGSIILTGIMLGVARIAGETAPLVMTALDSDGFGGFNTGSPSLTYKIFLYQYVSKIWTANAWAMSLVLVAMVLLISLATRSGLLSKLWHYATIKLLMIEFAVVVSIQTIYSLTTSYSVTTSLPLFIIVSLVLKYLIYDTLQKEDVMDKIWQNTVGKFIVLFVIIESALELIIYTMGTYDLRITGLIKLIFNQIYGFFDIFHLNVQFILTHFEGFFLILLNPIDILIAQLNNFYTKNAYLFLFHLSQFMVLGLGAFYIIKYYQKGFSGFDTIRLLIGYTFGLLLLRLTFFSLFMQFFYDIFVMLATGMVLLFILLYTIKRAQIVSDKIFNYYAWIMGAIVGLEILLYFNNFLLNYVYQINFRLSEVLIVVLPVYYIYYYFKIKTKDQPFDFEEIMKYVLTLGFIVMSVLLVFLQTSMIVFVFLTVLLLHFIIWYLILDNGYFAKIWNNIFGKLLVYIECLAIIVQGFLLIFNQYVNLVGQFNNQLFYVLVFAIIVFMIGKYLIDRKSNFDRAESILIGLFAINILQFVYPSLIPVNISLTYALAVFIFGQFTFGLLLKTTVVSLFLSKKEYNSMWNNISVRILVVLGILETIFELVVMFSNMFVKETIPIIMTVNGVLIYFILFYFLLQFIFKIDLIQKIFVRNVINYG